MRRLSGPKYRKRSTIRSGKIQSIFGIFGEIFCCVRAEVDGVGTQDQLVKLRVVERGEAEAERSGIQGYLAHKKHPPP